jgi:hypothetical protein
LVLVTVATLSAACGDDTGRDDTGSEGETLDVEATEAFLASASERSSGQPYRYKVTMDLELRTRGQDRGYAARLGEGEIVGESYEQHLDMTEYSEGFTAALGGAAPDLGVTVDMIGDAETLYLRAPAFVPSPGSDLPAELAQLGDGWGRVDLGALGDASLTEVQAQADPSPVVGDPRTILDMVSDAYDVTVLGEEEVGGEATNGLGATVAMTDLVAAQGLDPQEFTDQMITSAGGAAEDLDVAETVDRYLASSFPLELWVNDEGLVRRISYTTSLAQYGGLDAQASAGIDSYAVTTTIDYADHGDETIDTSPPPEADSALDVTDGVRELLGG